MKRSTSYLKNEGRSYLMCVFQIDIEMKKE